MIRPAKKEERTLKKKINIKVTKHRKRDENGKLVVFLYLYFPEVTATVAWFESILEKEKVKIARTVLKERLESCMFQYRNLQMYKFKHNKKSGVSGIVIKEDGKHHTIDTQIVVMPPEEEDIFYEVFSSINFSTLK